MLALERRSKRLNSVGAASSAAYGSACSSKRLSYGFAYPARGASYLTSCMGTTQREEVVL